MMRHLKPYQYLLAATAVSLLMPTSATAQVQELNVQRDTIPTYLKVQNKGIVNNALDSLPDDMRVVIHLIYFEDLSYDEAGKVMKKSRKQVDNLLYRAKKELRIILGKDGELLL